MTTTTLDDAPRARARSLSIPCPELLGLMVVAAALNLWGLSENGWANQYCSAAVRSMASSWHAFLYGSFDSTGLMTVDKPPLGAGSAAPRADQGAACSAATAPR